MENLYQSGVSQGTADKHLIKLTAIFSALLPAGMDNPFAGAIARGCENAPDLSYLPLSIDQIRSALDATKHRKGYKTTHEEHAELYGVFMTLAYTGLRMGDVFGLQCEEVMFDRNVLLVKCNKTSRKKSGSKSAFAKIGMHPALRDELMKQISGREGGPVFERLSKWTRQRQSNNVQLTFKRAGISRTAETGLGNTRSLYGAGSFRHTMEDRLRGAGIAQATINVILCHADRSMAATYATISDDEVVEAIAAAYPEM